MISLIDTLHHLFLPRHSNNHRAKLLHSSSLVALALLLVLIQSTLQIFSNIGVAVLGYAASISTNEVISLTNQKRLQLGLAPLESSADLAAAARAKGEDMLEDDYWAHVAPDGTEPWAFFALVHYDYRYAGENLARDFKNANDAVEAWMASPTHRDNMLSGNYREVGIAVVEGDLNGQDTTIIVQLFGTRATDTVPTVPVAAAQEPPTVVPSENVVENIAPSEQLVLTQPTLSQVVSPGVSEAVSRGSPLVTIPAFTLTQAIAVTVVGLLIGALVLDGIVVARKGIARTGGRLFAHLSFMGMVMAIILLAKAGQIL